MSGKDRYDWSTTDKLITEYYKTKTANEISEMCNGKFTPRQIRDRSRVLGLVKQPKHNWSEEEKQYVLDNYQETGARPIADRFRIPITSVEKMAQILGVKYIPKDSYISTQGYRVIGKSKNRISEHRKVMEEHLGRKLLSSEIVHHKDGDKTNNDISNLVLTNRTNHINEHRKDLMCGRTHKSVSQKI